MAGEVVFAFPVVVEGDWGAHFSRALKYKLTVYFQSRNKSGGGECQVLMDAAGAGRVTVQFVQEEVRQRVLSKKTHEIDMPERKKLKLTVSLPAEEAAPVETQTPKVPDRRQDYAGAKELNRPAQHQHLHPKQEASAVQKTEKEPKVGGVDSIITESSHIGIPDNPENVTEDPMTQEDFSLLVVPASEEDIETDIMEMYFENKKRSGGGPIKCCVKDCQQFIVTFENKAGIFSKGLLIPLVIPVFRKKGALLSS
uniref:PAR14-like first RRM domain-containing protein n=1 Tax=Anolis carolinensis TaxID=28377 RepID=A0A803TCB2_ANOCA